MAELLAAKMYFHFKLLMCSWSWITVIQWFLPDVINFGICLTWTMWCDHEMPLQMMDLDWWGLTGEVPGSLWAGKVLGVYSVLMDQGGISSSRPVVVRQQVSTEWASTSAHPRSDPADWNRRISDAQVSEWLKYLKADHVYLNTVSRMRLRSKGLAMTLMSCRLRRNQMPRLLSVFLHLCWRNVAGAFCPRNHACEVHGTFTFHAVAAKKIEHKW